jgi:hypothetical protein
MLRKNLIYLLIAAFITLLFSGPALSAAKTGQGWPLFKGAWFTIKYPPGFIVKPGQKSRTSVQGYDSAFFISPDRTVEFYVFSPQWQGTPEIDVDSANEVIISQNVETKNNAIVTWVTVKEKHGNYLRSWVDREDKLSNTRLVFGIKYQDQANYNKYRPDYLIFKKSLRQFAD